MNRKARREIAQMKAHVRTTRSVLGQSPLVRPLGDGAAAKNDRKDARR